MERYLMRPIFLPSCEEEWVSENKHWDENFGRVRKAD